MMNSQPRGNSATSSNIDQSIAKGQQFDSFSLFKSAVLEWGVAAGFAVRVSKSDKERVVFLCHHVDCKFRIAAWWRAALGKVD